MLSLTIDGRGLREAVGWIARMVPGRPPAPILGGILLETGDDSVSFAAYDFNTAGTTTAGAIVLTPGRAVVSGRLLGAIAKTLDPGKDVTLTDTGAALALSVGRNRWELPSMAVDDFPQLPAGVESAGKLDAAAFRRALDRVLPAADRSPDAPFHGTVKLEIARQTLKLVASDRYRLAIAEIDYAAIEPDIEIDVCLPTVLAEAMSHALPPDVSAAELGFTSGTGTISAGSKRLTGRLGAAEWPDWRSILPTGEPLARAIFAVADVQTALERVCAVADDDHALKAAIGPDAIQLEARGLRGGSARAEVGVSDFDGAAKTIAIKPRYLKHALDSMQSHLAAMRLGAAVDLCPIGDDGLAVSDFRYLVMPMSLAKLEQEWASF